MGRALKWERTRKPRETEPANPKGEEPLVPLPRRGMSKHRFDRLSPAWKDAIAKVYGRRG